MRILLSLLVLWILVTFALIPLVKTFRKVKNHTEVYIEKQFEKDNTEGDNNNELND